MCSAVVALLLVLASITPTQDKGSGNQRDRDEHAKENSTLFESGEASKLRTPPTAGEFRVVSYNIRWRSGDDLKKLIQLFREDAEIGNATVLALQEVDRNKKRSGKTNTAKLLADELGLYYAWAAPPSAKPNEEEETGVALLSAHPLTKIHRIVLPNEGPNHRRRVALGASIQMGNLEVRVYSAHAETRISMEKKLQQMNALLLDLKQHAPNSPVVIMGDLNTWQPDAARKTTLWMLVSQMAGGVLTILVIPLLRLVATRGPWVTIAAALLFACGLLMPLAFAAAVWRYRMLDTPVEALPQ